MGARLRGKLEAAERRVARLEAVLADGGPGGQVASAFHLGTVGGSGRNVRRLNARKVAHLDRVIDAAVALPLARVRVADLRARIARAAAPAPAPKPAAPKRPRPVLREAERARLHALATWYFYGGADDAPPVANFTQAELDRAKRLYERGALTSD